MRNFIKNLLIVLSVTACFAVFQLTGLLNKLVPSQLADTGMGYIALFVTGLFTSLHCIAMCGGINLSQSITAEKSFEPTLAYNAGRVISYTIIGLILGVVGYIIGGGATVGVPVLLQGILKIIAGIFMVLAGADLLGLFADFKLQIAGFVNWLGMKLPSICSDSSCAFTIAPFIPFVPSVRTSSAPYAFRRFLLSILIVSGIVMIIL